MLTRAARPCLTSLSWDIWHQNSELSPVKLCLQPWLGCVHFRVIGHLRIITGSTQGMYFNMANIQNKAFMIAELLETNLKEQLWILCQIKLLWILKMKKVIHMCASNWFQMEEENCKYLTIYVTNKQLWNKSKSNCIIFYQNSCTQNKFGMTMVDRTSHLYKFK